MLVAQLLPAAVTETITGKVQDQSKAALPDVVVKLKLGGKPVVEQRTGTTGEFAFAIEREAEGKIAISAEMDGFTTERLELDWKTAQTNAIEITLSVAGSTHTVTVTEKVSYGAVQTSAATKTPTALINIPQSITTIQSEQMRDQSMMSMADVVRYVPGISMAQGEGHRDAPVIRGNATTADFFVNGVRDDVQYFRDLYNLERVEALKGPNAMIFGRGGGGGVLNRVTKEAGFTPFREISVMGGMFGQKRISGDFDQPINRWAAFRLNSMFEDSGSYRRYSDINRYGIAPTLTLLPTQTTKLRIGYEYFHDGRLIDRGIPSFQGRPLDVDHRQFFGNPDASRSRANVNLGNVILEQQLGGWNLRNQTLFGSYDKFYQNVLPGAVEATRTFVNLTGYNDATGRNNFFNQTDLVRNLKTGNIRHTILSGVEVGRQVSDSFRNTGYFNNATTTITVPIIASADFTPITFRQSATDANNHVTTRVGATYIQDQIELSRFVQIVAGVRLDHFDQNVFNRRADQTLRRIDNMFSPRTGIVVKPIRNVSLYGNYSVSFLPSSGDQFASLTATTQSLKPEKFQNYEVGSKWDLSRGLSINTAFFLLDRTNTTAPDPTNPARIVQTGSQRSKGVEFGLSGRVTRAWSVAGGYAWQNAFISSRTAAALAGARVPNVPRNQVSFWNHYRILPRLSGGLGLIHQDKIYAAIDNAVLIPGFTRADAALFYTLGERVKLQANCENLTDRSYIVNSHNNNNLTPGMGRTLRIGMTFGF